MKIFETLNIVFAFIFGMATMNFLISNKEKINQWLSVKSKKYNVTKEKRENRYLSNKTVISIGAFSILIFVFLIYYFIGFENVVKTNNSDKLVVHSLSTDSKEVEIYNYEDEIEKFTNFDIIIDNSVKIPYYYQSFGINFKEDLFGNSFDEVSTKNSYVVMSYSDFKKTNLDSQTNFENLRDELRIEEIRSQN